MSLIQLWASLCPFLSTQQYVRQLSEPLQFIGNISAKVKIALQYLEPHPYYHNVFMSIQEDYRMMQEGLVVRKIESLYTGDSSNAPTVNILPKCYTLSALIITHG